MGLIDSLAVESLHGLPPLLLFAYLLVAYIVLNWAFHAVYNIYFHPLRHFPGPRIWLVFPILRHINSIRGTREHKILADHERYGPVVRTDPETLTFTDPQAWADIYGHGHPELPKTLGRARRPVPDIIFADAKTHARYRRAMLPAFSEKALGEQEGLIKVYVDLLMQRLGEVAAKGEATDMVKWFNYTTFDLIGDLTFGEPLGGLESGATNVWVERIRKALRALPLILTLRLYIPGLGVLLGSLFKKSQRQHQAMVKTLVQKRIANAEYDQRGDFMDQMMRHRGKGSSEQQALTDDELTVNADILMIAGSETTATLLSGVTYFLLANPDKLARLTDEVRSAFPTKNDINFAAAASRLPYLLACLNEALRLYPPVPVAVLRQTLPGPPTPIAGHMVPENTMVGVHQLAAYRTSHNWHRPGEFLPERWLLHTSTNTTTPEHAVTASSPFNNDSRAVHKPFSHGPRDCLGRTLALHEMRLVLARLVWEFDLVRPPVPPAAAAAAKEEEEWPRWSVQHQRIRLFWDKPPLMIGVRRRVE